MAPVYVYRTRGICVVALTVHNYVLDTVSRFFGQVGHETTYLSNSRGGWNKRGGGAKVAKSICKRRGWDFWEKLVHNCNKRGVEGGKNL